MMKLDEIDRFEKAIICMEVLLFVPTVFGNVLILISIGRFRWLQTPLNGLVGNLAVSDLVTVLILTPGHIVGAFLELNRVRSFCLFYLSSIVAFVLVSLLTMMAISVERYYSVGFPWKHRASKRHKFVTLFIPISWILSLLLSIVPVFGWNSFTSSDNRCNIDSVWPLPWKVLLTSLVVTIIIIKVILFALIVKVARSRLPTCSDDLDRKNVRKQIVKMYILMAMCAAFLVCWGPFCVISLSQLILVGDELNVAKSLALLLGFLNCALNWLIYGLKTGRFRKAFKLILCGRRHVLENDQRERS